MHATLHSRRCTCTSWADAVKVTNSTCTYVGDLGPAESRLCRFRGHIAQMFGDWAINDDAKDVENVEDDNVVPSGEEGPDEIHFDFQNIDAAIAGSQGEHGGVVEIHAGVEDDTVFQCHPIQNSVGIAQDRQEEVEAEPCAPCEPINTNDYPCPDDPYFVDCTASIFIPGMMHILSNITKDLGGAMSYWKQFVIYLKAVCNLLSKNGCERDSRRLVSLWAVLGNITKMRLTASTRMYTKGDGEQCFAPLLSC